MKDPNTLTPSNTSISGNVTSFDITGENSYSLSFSPKYETQEEFNTPEEVMTGKKIKPYEDPVIRFNQTIKGMEYVNTAVWNGITYLPRTIVTSVLNSVQWFWHQLPSINLPIAMAKENSATLKLHFEKTNLIVDRDINRDESTREGKKNKKYLNDCGLAFNDIINAEMRKNPEFRSDILGLPNKINVYTPSCSLFAMQQHLGIGNYIKYTGDTLSLVTSDGKTLPDGTNIVDAVKKAFDKYEERITSEAYKKDPTIKFLPWQKELRKRLTDTQHPIVNHNVLDKMDPEILPVTEISTFARSQKIYDNAIEELVYAAENDKEVRKYLEYINEAATIRILLPNKFKQYGQAHEDGFNFVTKDGDMDEEGATLAQRVKEAWERIEYRQSIKKICEKIILEMPDDVDNNIVSIFKNMHKQVSEQIALSAKKPGIKKYLDEVYKIRLLHPDYSSKEALEATPKNTITLITRDGITCDDGTSLDKQIRKECIRLRDEYDIQSGYESQISDCESGLVFWKEATLECVTGVSGPEFCKDIYITTHLFEHAEITHPLGKYTLKEGQIIIVPLGLTRWDTNFRTFCAFVTVSDSEAQEKMCKAIKDVLNLDALSPSAFLQRKLYNTMKWLEGKVYNQYKDVSYNPYVIFINKIRKYSEEISNMLPSHTGYSIYKAEFIQKGGKLVLNNIINTETGKSQEVTKEFKQLIALDLIWKSEIPPINDRNVRHFGGRDEKETINREFPVSSENLNTICEETKSFVKRYEEGKYDYLKEISK